LRKISVRDRRAFLSVERIKETLEGEGKGKGVGSSRGG